MIIKLPKYFPQANVNALMETSIALHGLHTNKVGLTLTPWKNKANMFSQKHFDWEQLEQLKSFVDVSTRENNRREKSGIHFQIKMVRREWYLI